jgi:hypothetical protein
MKTTTHACLLLCAAMLAQTFDTPLAPRAAASDTQTQRRTATTTQARADSDTHTPNAADAFGKLPLTFEVNRGQADPRAEYLARGAGYTLMLTRAGALLSLKSHVGEAVKGGEAARAETLRLSFPGANPAARPAGRGLAETRSNYLKGRDPAEWLTGVENYERVVYERLYEGVDLVFHGSASRPEYDFRVAAGADARPVRVRFDGARGIRLDREGTLVLRTRAGEVRQPRPFAYQEDGEGRRTQVACDYVLGRRGEVGFRLGAYDRARQLVIDPFFVYSTYLGVPGGVQGVASDAAGNAYMTGTDGGDVLVLKINPAGTDIIYATHVGGSGSDAGLALALDGSGNAYVTGTTVSPNFPTSATAFDKTCGNSGTCNDGSGIQSDAFVFKLNPAGSNLVYSTYLGGSGAEPIPGQVNWPTTPRMGIAVNAFGLAYVTGSTTSLDFPTTPGAFSTTPGTSYVARLSSTGSLLQYSTYFPGAIAQAIAVDANDQAYITGMTTTSDGNPSTLPVVNAYQPTLGGQFTFDAFAAKLNAAGSSLLFSTFLGGPEATGDTPRGGDDYGNDIGFDSSMNVYVAGGTRSGCFPNANPYVAPTNCPSGGGQKEFLVKFAPAGNTLLFSKKLTTLVSADGELSVEPSGTATVAWSCQNAATLFDVCVDRVSTDGVTQYTTRFGGSANERVTGVLAGGGGQVYVVGHTSSADYPVTPNVLHTTIGGATDSFAARIRTEFAELRFDAPNIDVAEGAGKVTVRINRSGDISNFTRVDYTTEDVTASGRADYAAAAGSILFEPGETFKLVDVFITDDTFGPEGDETFNFNISASGFVPGTPATAIVRILDNDAAPGPNPIEPPGFNPDFFVRQHYIDFLSREPDAAGLAFWKGELSGCGLDAACLETKRINVSAAFFQSIEFQETGYFVHRIYKTAFGDTTSPGVPGTVPIIRFGEFLIDAQKVGRGVVVGPGPWQQQLEANKVAFTLEIAQSQRFLVAYPFSMTTEEFVDKLNQNAGGVLTQAERDQLVAEVNSGSVSARALILRRFVEDEDLKRNELRRAFVLMQYFGYLRRNPDDSPEPGLNFGGWKFWLDKLNEFDGDFVRAEMVKAFLSSDEYRHRFGP